MANTVALSAANTNTQIDDNVRNPDVVTAGGAQPQRRIVHITLVVENTTVTPDLIYDGLDSVFPVVASNKTSLSRGCWEFNIGPA